jgi:hypothetical protein
VKQTKKGVLSSSVVPSAKEVKQTKKGALSSSVALGAARVGTVTSGSKALANGMKKAATPIQKRRIPLECMLAETSSEESQESSPHDPLPQAATKAAHEASLQLAPAAYVSGASASHCYYIHRLVIFILHVCPFVYQRNAEFWCCLV